MKSLMMLWQRVAQDAATQCCTSATRDLERVARRFKHEGIELLTLSLPQVGKAFENALDRGEVTDNLRSLCGSQAGFPLFLRNFLQLVFDRTSFQLLDDPSPDAIQAIRQLTTMFSKVLLPCSDAREKAAFEDYIKCEQELRDSVSKWSDDLLSDFTRIGSVLFGDIFSAIDRDIYDGEIIPKHGPGATADKLTGNLKYQQTEWTERLEAIFPATENLIPSFRYHQSLDELQFLDPGSERPVKVISVPKTAKSPRIIAIEPTCQQYMQQGLMEKFVEYIETPILHRRRNIVSSMLGFTDQQPNQLLACEGSLYGELATLDLSEASDRVSLPLVTSMLSHWPWLLQAVLATRSTRADIPGHGIHTLTKYASMGSALTFPLEECVFLIAIFHAIERSIAEEKGWSSWNLTYEDVKTFEGKVRVYGDDIIIPVGLVQPVIESLELFGFKVNRDKSFWNGSFRESCGKEYYDGHDVSIFRVRQVLPGSRADVPAVISTVSLRNQAYKAGYWGTARYLDELLEGMIPFPNVAESSAVLGRHSFLGYDEERIDPDLQSPLVRGMVIQSRIPLSPVVDEFALLKCLLKRGLEPFADERHLERQGRPRSVSIKTRWSSPI